MGVVTVPESKQSASGKRAFRPSSGIRHSPQWPVSDVISDLIIEVGSSSFSLHKFPLVSRSGRIRKLLLETKDSKNAQRLSLPSLPGGSEAFELAAKFCYGVTVDFTSSNIAAVRCAAHYLDMTEEVSEKNLEARAEAFLRDSIFTDISKSITVLHSCERLFPVAEDITLVGRLINAIAVNACKEQLASGLLKLDQKFASVGRLAEAERSSDWWGRSLPILKLDFFQRVLSAMKSKGLNQDIISEILMSYARNSLQIIRDPNLVKVGSAIIDSDQQKKQRTVLESIVGLLPTQANKSSIPISFLSSLLKTAIGSSASVSCRSDLERRISHQLDQAILEDILIPASGSHGHGAMYDTDSVQRIFSMFLNLDECDYGDDDGDLVDESELGLYDFEGAESPKQSSILKVSKLMDSFLAEVALDSNLPPAKFIALAELLPDHARLVCDALYRAVDIFLKVHPNMKDSERYRLCKTINCQKLSQDASSHAAQNERLPVQIAVQVLFYEQTRLKNAMSSSGRGSIAGQSQFFFFQGQFPHRSASGAASGAISPRDNYASVRRENRDLRLEVARMRMRLTELEKDHVSMKREFVKPSGGGRGRNRLFRTLTRGLSKLNAIVFRLRSSESVANGKHHTEEKTNSERRFMFQKKRCHSVS
ncbi:PREDICTED: BTB/POZ domain-containing protein SETH6 isoform X2 [Tarenaya hassleriana]|uniref:BTB/POZ domain-containing protein SETH6 isoform X2 n=1 Tax=Tarenaya hassleriana TaxID=28532 RepID=UPI00053C75AF|nr:PREDICTED: BTB/POZ domain-containing protein SETH6 isoform X2 [Tarenaya hassleriana]